VLNIRINTSYLVIIYLMVRADNLNAIRLYKNMGFDLIAMLQDDIKTPEGDFDGVLMRKFVRAIKF
jgi:ribosomal protein S18 acetylase RimI-like enzyme